jgi:hypothetical protein
LLLFTWGVSFEISNENSSGYWKMAVSSHRSSSQSTHRRSEISAEVGACKSKDTKGKWFSQIKDWVLTSEPSTQALKNYKKDAFKRAGIRPDDPQAPAKLHIPTTTLPPEAIKPAGPGPYPEEVMQRRAEQKRRLRQSLGPALSSSGGSRMSASRQSSLSSLPSKVLSVDS